VPRLIAAAEAIGIKDRVTVLREGETLIEPVRRKQQAS
jgi:hypothetical protein